MEVDWVPFGGLENADGTIAWAALAPLARIPRQELEWLMTHGNLEVWEAGTIVAPKGKRIETLWVLLSGHIAIRVDRGAGAYRSFKRVFCLFCLHPIVQLLIKSDM
jgi:signal-transduction protein with cAMP-binding, CBS, and nucleotidyltransferase domain